MPGLSRRGAGAYLGNLGPSLGLLLLVLLTFELGAVLGSKGCLTASLVSSPRCQQPLTPETTQAVCRLCQMAPGSQDATKTHHVKCVCVIAQDGWSRWGVAEGVLTFTRCVASRGRVGPILALREFILAGPGRTVRPHCERLMRAQSPVCS